MRASLIAGLLALALSPAVHASTEGAQKGFVAPREKIEKPYTNNKCLKDCHEDRNLKAGGEHGQRRDLFVDLDGFFASTHGQRGLWCIDCHAGADPNFHPREGYAKVDCRACHSEKPPEGVFPPDAASILKERDVKPPRKELLKGDGWTGSAHGKAWAEGKDGAPFCSDCHTAHYVRPAKDPLSTVNTCALPKTCGKCHVDQTRNVDVGGALARWSIAGHGKGDFSQVYSEAMCLSCHQGQAAHGENTVTGQACPSCHRPKENLEAGKKGFHIAVGDDAPLSGRLLRYVYDLLFWGGLGSVLMALVFWGVTSLYRKNDQDGE